MFCNSVSTVLTTIESFTLANIYCLDNKYFSYILYILINYSVSLVFSTSPSFSGSIGIAL